MVKKKTSKSKVNTDKPKIRHLGLKILFGVPLLLLLAFLGFELFKEIVTRQDIKKLDQAEAKMRQLDIASAEGAIFSRSCSERSVKFGDPGKPSCRVKLTYMSSSDPTESTKNVKGQLEQLGANISDYDASSDFASYTVGNFSGDLTCRLIIRTNVDIGSQAVYCQKKFWKKAYPIN